jgi:hypothetical protein
VEGDLDPEEPGGELSPAVLREEKSVRRLIRLLFLGHEQCPADGPVHQREQSKRRTLRRKRKAHRIKR